MGFEMPPRPKFLERALQGLAFWIGHRHSLFSGYLLPEAAMVAEMCNLIQANLKDGRVLIPEQLYRILLPENVKVDELSKLARADLAIYSARLKEIASDSDKSPHVHFVIEVKRGLATNSAIDNDLRRLCAFLRATRTNARAFLIVVSESKTPKRFVARGVSKLGTFDIPESNGCFHVRRTVKASATFSHSSTSTHYVCLLEVFTDRPKKLPPL